MAVSGTAVVDVLGNLAVGQYTLQKKTSNNRNVFGTQICTRVICLINSMRRYQMLNNSA